MNKDREQAERAYDEELKRLGEDVRYAASALQHTQDRMRFHADNHESFIKYKMAVYAARRGK